LASAVRIERVRGLISAKLYCFLLSLLLVSPTFAKESTDKPYAGSTQPPLSPAEAQKKFAVPPGFEVRLFAAEPDMANPVAMTFDEKGRLWVVELYEYPNGAKPGTKGRDRVKVYWEYRWRRRR